MPEVPENVRGSIAFTRQFGTAESGSARTIVKPNGEVAKPVKKQKRLSLIAPPENIPSREQKIGHRIWFRQRGTLLSFLLFLLSSISAFLYYVPFLYGVRRSDMIGNSIQKDTFHGVKRRLLGIRSRPCLRFGVRAEPWTRSRRFVFA